MAVPLVNRDDARVMKEIVRQRKPKVVNIESVSPQKATLMSTDEQIEMLKTIENYNKALPERKFVIKKNHLPELTSSNVDCQQRLWMDQNDKKVPRMKFKYGQIGLVDGTTRSALSNHDKFSVYNKVRFI